MIKTKSLSCKGANSRKLQPQNKGAGCDYNPALQNLQFLILRLRDVMLNP